MVDDLWSTVDKALHHTYVERQTVPFVTSQAVYAVMQIIEVITNVFSLLLYETYGGNIAKLCYTDSLLLSCNT